MDTSRASLAPSSRVGSVRGPTVTFAMSASQPALPHCNFLQMMKQYRVWKHVECDFQSHMSRTSIYRLARFLVLSLVLRTSHRPLCSDVNRLIMNLYSFILRYFYSLTFTVVPHFFVISSEVIILILNGDDNFPKVYVLSLAPVKLHYVVAW